MAEQTQTTEITPTKIQKDGSIISRAGQALDSFKKFSNEPAVQRSIPVMITLFVIFMGIMSFINL